MTIEPQQQTTAWHLDRKVPLAIIAALVLQTLAGGWWSGAIQTRVDSFDYRIIKLEDERSTLLQRLTAVETGLANQSELLRGQNAVLNQILTELRQR